MEQRDYLKKQIDELGQVLGKVITELLQLKSQGKFNDGLEITNQTLKTNLDHNVGELLAIPDETFIAGLKARKIKNEGLDKLAELLLLLADNEEAEAKKLQLYKKSFLLFEKLESVEAIYSMDRHRKLERLKKILGTA